MNQRIVYSKTGKGVLEIKNKAGKLSRVLTKVLTLVDGKSAVADLIAKSKLPEADIAKHIAQLEDSGYIKEFSSLSGATSSSSPSSGSSAYVDDLDFTSQLSPGRRVYSSSQVEMRDRESADRKRAESDANLKRQQEEQKKKNLASQQAKEEAVRLTRIEAERKAREAAAIKARQQSELKAKQQAAEMEKTTRDLAKILEAERQALEKADRQKRQESALKVKEEARLRAQEDSQRKRKQEQERQLREEAERKQREEEERKRKEAEAERKQREEEERKRKEEAERKQREEEERKRKEEEERKQREEEERKRKEEEERKQREEEERKRKEEEELRRREEEDRRRAEEDKRREEEDQRRAEEERARRDGEDRHREEEDRRRAEERQRREEEEVRYRDEEEPLSTGEEEADDEPVPSLNFDIGNFDLPSDSSPDSSPASETQKSSGSSFDLAASAGFESSDDFAANFDQQQERLKEQEEEKERQRQAVEAERDEAERAQREEEAKEEAERRAAKEAEMRTRVEQEKAERAERERAKEEEYKNKIEQDEEQKRAEAGRKQLEEQQRVDAERNQREEDLVRRRQQSEEADRKRAELKSLQKRGKIRSPLERARPFIIGVAVVVGLVFGAVNLMPMSGYIPAVEKMVSDKVGEPVTIGSIKMSLLSGFEFRLGNVNIGSTQDVTLTDVVVVPEVGSLLGDRMVLKSIRADGGNVVKEALARMPDWLETSMGDQRVDVRSISLRSIKLDVRTFSVPTMNADLTFARDGSIGSATIESADGKLSVDINKFDGQTAVAIVASNWSPPVGAPVQFTDFTGKGTLSGATLTLNQWNATAYGGELKGTAEMSWSPRWRLSSQFEFVRIETEEMLAVFSDTARVTGLVSGKGRLTAQSGSVDTLLDKPSLNANFVVKKGAVDGVDLVRALQAGRSGTQGGSTRFEQLSGELAVSNGRFTYREVELGAGILSALGNFDISSKQEVSGRVRVDLRSTAQQLNASLNISGTLKGVLLRP